MKRLNNSTLHFEIEGEGYLITGCESNNVRLEWGTAPVIVRSTLRNGRIKVKASVLKEGALTPEAGEIELESVPSDKNMIYSESEAKFSESVNPINDSDKSSFENDRKKREESSRELKEVERQQNEFGE